MSDKEPEPVAWATRKRTMDKPDIVDVLNNPEPYYPYNFKTAEQANALYSWLCQKAAEEIIKLREQVKSS